VGGRATPEKMMDALTMRARALNLGARVVVGGALCSWPITSAEAPHPSPHSPPTRRSSRHFPVNIFSRKSAKNGSLLLTCSHATLRVLGFIENRLGNALMQTLILWFWRRSKLLEADAHGVSLRFGCALFLATFSEQTLFLSQLRLLSETNSTVAFLL